MKTIRQLAIAFLTVIFIVTLLAGVFAPSHYATQFRDIPDAAPSHQHPLGTDELGRDSFSRLLYGSRVSLVLAPLSALLSTLIAAVVGAVAGHLGGWWERVTMRATDVFLSLPWLFLLLTVRAMLPLNVSGMTSVVITFALLGFLGWAAAARVVCAGTRALRTSDFVLQARACGCRGTRLLFLQILPNLTPILAAQFWISIPVFILTEANLGLLGLGVTEPLPSWGNLLRDLESYQTISANPSRLVPLVLLILVVSCFQILVSREDLAG